MIERDKPTGEVVNLRRARKLRERHAAEAKAQENRAAFGRPKAERVLTNARLQKDSQKLDLHKRSPTTDGDR